MLKINPWVALAVVGSTATTDALYVMFSAAVQSRQRALAATFSSAWYLLAAFAVISYTTNPAYVVFAAIGSWIGAFGAVTWLRHTDGKVAAALSLKMGG